MLGGERAEERWNASAKRESTHPIVLSGSTSSSLENKKYTNVHRTRYDITIPIGIEAIGGLSLSLSLERASWETLLPRLCL